MWCALVCFDLASETKHPQEPKEGPDALNSHAKDLDDRDSVGKMASGDLCSKMVRATKVQTVFRGRICVGFSHADITGEQPEHPQPAGLVPILEMCSCEPFPNI